MKKNRRHLSCVVRQEMYNSTRLLDRPTQSRGSIRAPTSLLRQGLKIMTVGSDAAILFWFAQKCHVQFKIVPRGTRARIHTTKQR